MKKTSKIRTRILAAALSAVTIFSVSAMTATTASAAAPPTVVGTVLKYMTGKSFGYAKDSVMKLAGPELSKMGLSPILNMVLGIEDDQQGHGRGQGAFNSDSQLPHTADESA